MDKKELREVVSDGNVQASLLLTVGPGVWKAISNVSNVDFLLGLNGEKFKMFLGFLEGPGWAILMAIGAVWLFARISYREYLPFRSGPTWPLLCSASIVSFMFGILIAVNSTGVVPQLFAGWGSQNPRQCVSAVDMNKLLSFAKDYKFAVVCGIQDDTKDRLENENITVSNRFTITPGAQPIISDVSKAMSDQMAQLIKDAQAKSGNPNVAVQMPMWYDVILLPNEVPTSKITKLNDVLVLGGKVLNPQYFH